MTTPSPDTTTRPWGLRRDRGASLLDYALIVVLALAVCVVAVTFFGHAASRKDGPDGARTTLDRPHPTTQLLPLTPA